MQRKTSDAQTTDRTKREVLPIPDVPRIGLTTYDAKDHIRLSLSHVDMSWIIRCTLFE